MQEKGLFNKTITHLAETIYSETTFKTNQQLVNKGKSLGIPVDQNYSKERNIFVITQTILTLIDEIVISEKKQRYTNTVKKQMVGVVKVNQAEKTTLDYSPKCLMGNLNIAVMIYQMFCPKLVVWDIIEKMTSIKRLLQEQQGIFQVVHLNNRIFQLQNSQRYKCYCQMLASGQESCQTINCHHCLQEFHPGCQSNPLFCNGCFLRFCLMDLSQELNDPFNSNKEIKTQFFGYFKNCWQDQPSDLAENIYFHVVKFNLENFQQQADRKQKYVQIRLSVVDKIFPDELILPTKNNGLRPKRQANWFWPLDEVEHYFFLNHNQLKYTTSISKHSIILKIPHRILESKNNIFVIKSVRRNQRYKVKDNSVLMYWKDKESKEKIVMIGVYQVQRKKKSKNSSELREPAPNIIPNVTVYQSYHYLQFVEQKINQVPYQFVNLYNSSATKKIQQPVRSFGCQHIECFDYLQFKEQLKPPKAKPKPSKKAQDNRFLGMNEPLNCIQIDSHSSSIVQIAEKPEGQQIQVSKSTQIQSFSLELNVPPSRKMIHKTHSLDLGRKKKAKVEGQTERQLLCPICQRKLLILYNDPLFKQIIFNSGFYKKVKILSSGEYTFQDIRKADTPSETIEIQ